jgi:hypothetical protein
MWTIVLYVYCYNRDEKKHFTTWQGIYTYVWRVKTHFGGHFKQENVFF